MYLVTKDEEETPEVARKGDSKGPTGDSTGDPKTAHSPNTVTELEVQ
jgi:hypothetical protein